MDFELGKPRYDQVCKKKELIASESFCHDYIILISLVNLCRATSPFSGRC